MRSLLHAALLVALGSAATTGCRGAPPIAAPGHDRAAARAAHGGEVTSNILRADYIGSRSCEPCHAREYAAWLDSPMHRMTRDLHQTTIRAPFGGELFTFRGDSVTMDQIGAERFMRLHPARGQDSLFRVTKVIGGRYREDFVGAPVDPAAPLGSDNGDERILPASFLSF